MLTASRSLALNEVDKKEVNMSGVKELDRLLSAIKPRLSNDEFVFCTVAAELSDYAHLSPVATFLELEGLTLVLLKHQAQNAGLKYESSFRQITLMVYSSLESVGLTAAVSARLASKSISANVIAAYYHDHIFVPYDKAEQALLALNEFNE
jgi:hypothetical protein